MNRPPADYQSAGVRRQARTDEIRKMSFRQSDTIILKKLRKTAILARKTNPAGRSQTDHESAKVHLNW